MKARNDSLTTDYGEARVDRDCLPAIDALPALAVVDGQGINVSGISDTIDRILDRLARPASFLVCTVNLDHLVKRRRDPAFLRAYRKAEIASADGFPISVLARFEGVTIKRAPGSDLVMPLCARAAEHNLPVFLIGTTFNSLCLSAKHLVLNNPGLNICGIYAPPPDFESQSESADEAITLIRESGARICFVAMGAPKQEIFAARAAEETGNIAFVAIGGGLDFLAGTQIRCPRIVRRIYLEWAWRLMLSPRRLGLRYFRCAVLFVDLLFQAGFNRRPPVAG
jgi:N-acetylglucosaminyldiphosphoundecaprenol N-acetyl-beta-D-mannosaminyltransferase